jgi:CO/xanthine dehydrogenase Mo-binding subunit
VKGSGHDDLDPISVDRSTRVEAGLVNNDELPPQGGGEPAITTTGAVLANAVFDAVGARMLRLPMLPDRVRQTIAAESAG